VAFRSSQTIFKIDNIVAEIMFTVYAIKSFTSGRIYIGQTKNVQSRLRDHNAGRVQPAKNEKPWALYALQNMENRKQIMKMEWKLKCSKGTRLRWLEEHTISNGTLFSKKKSSIPKVLQVVYPRRGL
jgi:putative endonuclease